MQSKKKVLIIVDVQNGFVNEYSSGVLENVKKLVASNIFDTIVATKFVNSENSLFFKNLGNRRMFTSDETKICLSLPKHIEIEKTSYKIPNKAFKKLKKTLKNSDVYICGMDICSCVLAICFQLFDAKINVRIIWDAVATFSKNCPPFDNMKIIYGRNFGSDAIINVESLIGEKYGQ